MSLIGINLLQRIKSAIRWMSDLLSDLRKGESNPRKHESCPETLDFLRLVDSDEPAAQACRQAPAGVAAMTIGLLFHDKLRVPDRRFHNYVTVADDRFYDYATVRNPSCRLICHYPRVHIGFVTVTLWRWPAGTQMAGASRAACLPMQRFPRLAADRQSRRELRSSEADRTGDRVLLRTRQRAPYIRRQ